MIVSQAMRPGVRAEAYIKAPPFATVLSHQTIQSSLRLLHVVSFRRHLDQEGPSVGLAVVKVAITEVPHGGVTARDPVKRSK